MLLMVATLALGIYWVLPLNLRWSWLVVSSLIGLAFISMNSVLYSVFLLTIVVLFLSYTRILLVGLLLQLIAFKIWAPQMVVGISFLTFFLIHYVVDVHRGKIDISDQRRLIGRAIFLPLLTAGPIERFQHFVDNQASTPLWTRAGWCISLGIIQKWVLADGLVVSFLNGWTGATLAEQGLSLHPIMLWTILVGLFFQLYCDFAGYSNLAIGVSALFGFHIAANFNRPMLAMNPAEFWKRWHISLSSWCQEYVYMPMLGRTRNAYVGILSTFLVMGLWHAISWHWLCWGLMHAVAVMLHLRWRRYSRGFDFVHSPFWKIFSWLSLMIFLAMTGVFTQLHGHASLVISFNLLLHSVGLK